MPRPSRKYKRDRKWIARAGHRMTQLIAQGVEAIESGDRGLPLHVRQGIQAELRRMLVALDREWQEQHAGNLMIHAGMRQMVQGVLRTRIEQIQKEIEVEIAGVPRSVRQELRHEALHWQTQGLTTRQATEAIRRALPKLSRTKVELIARTETARASSVLEQAQSQAYGFEWYEWLGAEDARERQAHRHMNGVLVTWSDPPAPEKLIGIRSKLGHYHAGRAPRCRCIAATISGPEDVKWPHKVYRRGKIERMTLKQFRALG